MRSRKIQHLQCCVSSQKTNNFKIKKPKYSNTQFEKDFGFSPKTYPNLKYDIQMYDVNGWKVVNGFFNNKDRTESWGNNLQSYFVYPNSSEEPLYSCWESVHVVTKNHIMVQMKTNSKKL